MSDLPVPWYYLSPLALLLLAGVWLVLSRLVRAWRHRDRRAVARRLDAEGPEAAADLLRSQGKGEEAAELLAENGRYDLAAHVWEELGEYRKAAGAAALAGKKGRAAALFARAGDSEMTMRMLEGSARPFKVLQLLLKGGQAEEAATFALENITDRAHLKRLAHYLRERELHDLAIPLLEKSRSRRELGRLYEETGRSSEAIAHYLKHRYHAEAARVHADMNQHAHAARLLLKCGMVGKAIDQLELGNELLAAARLCRRLGNQRRALEILGRLEPDSPHYRDGTLIATAILEARGQYAEAAQRLNKLLAHGGYSQATQEICLRTVDLQIEIGDYSGAIRNLEKARLAGLETPGLNDQIQLLRRAEKGTEAPKEKPLGGEAMHAGLVRATTNVIGLKGTDRYSLKQRLARGGHSMLFLAWDRKLEREVVLKLLYSENLPSAVAREYFVREARAAGSLSHPNIVKILDAGELQGRPFIAMEFVEGKTLLDLAEGNGPPLTDGQKLKLSMQICDGLALAHSHSVIHRDIKMENVMVTSDGQAKLLDFGIAKILDEDPERSLFVLGTPPYMSPEQATGDFLDLRTDIYSLGVLLYRLFTAALPFTDDEVMHFNRPKPRDPAEVRQGLSPRLAKTIMRCLDNDREQRFGSASELRQALQDCAVEM